MILTMLAATRSTRDRKGWSYASSWPLVLLRSLRGQLSSSIKARTRFPERWCMSARWKRSTRASTRLSTIEGCSAHPSPNTERSKALSHHKTNTQKKWLRLQIWRTLASSEWKKWPSRTIPESITFLMNRWLGTSQMLSIESIVSLQGRTSPQHSSGRSRNETKRQNRC